VGPQITSARATNAYCVATVPAAVAPILEKELANEADLRVLAPASTPAPCTQNENRDQRLPAPGAIITRTYKGQAYSVEVLACGFNWNDTTYKTLTAVAEAITGMHLNGYQFFGLLKGDV